jgi:hypothetical protein
MADLSVNWQVIIGLANVPTTEWEEHPVGHIEDFGAGYRRRCGARQEPAGCRSLGNTWQRPTTSSSAGSTAMRPHRRIWRPTRPRRLSQRQQADPIALAYTNAGCS